MTEQATEVRKRKRGRSPSYPGIDLGEAIERARALYEKEAKHAAPINAILAHWGYKAGSGPGLVAFAALKKFGLLVEEGSGRGRKGRLSDEALAIILDGRPDSPDRLRRIQEAALRPLIHQELWQKYAGNLPSEETLRYELQVEKGFTERAVKEFIPEYKQTIEFAGLPDRDKLSGQVEDRAGVGERRATPPTPRTVETGPIGGETRAVQIPISTTKWAMLQAPFPLTEAEWNQMKAVLDAMKPALVISREFLWSPAGDEEAGETGS
jgi:hypothetical protein